MDLGPSANADSTTAAQRDRFFANNSLLVAALVFASFPLTYYVPVATSSRHFAPILHIHGVIFFTWAVLYAWQSHLVANGEVAKHRELGLAGIAVSALMLPLGVIAAAEAIGRRKQAGDPTPYDFAFYNLLDIALFSVLMVAGIAAVTRHREWHRRFIYGAALCLLSPAFSRWTLRLAWPLPLGDWVVYMFDVLLIVLALHDRRVLGRIHPATWCTIALLIPLHIASPFLAYSEWWRTIAPSIFNLMH